MVIFWAVPAIETVMDGVEDQVGIDLGEAAREGVDAQLGIALDVHLALGLLELVAEGDHHLMQVVGEAEVVAGLGGLIHCHLLEAGDELRGASQVALQQLHRLVEILGEFAEVGAGELLGLDMLLEVGHPLLQVGGGGDADADGGVDLVGHAGNQGTEEAIFSDSTRVCWACLRSS
jgi:hypothetical protein